MRERRGAARELDVGGPLRLEFNGPQTRAYKHVVPGHTLTLPWGRGVGKSWFLRCLCHLLVAQWDGRWRPSVPVLNRGLSIPKRPGVRIVFLMPTLEQFRKVHLPDFLYELESEWSFLGAGSGKGSNKTSLRFNFPGHSWVQVVSAEAAQGARGLRCDVLVGDEIDDVDPEVLEAISQAWFTEPHSLRITILGGTPKRGRYGILYAGHASWPNDPRLAATHHSVHATCYDAPRQVDRAYVEGTIRPKTRAGIFAREYLADFDAAEGLVYAMFRADFHVREADYGVPWSEILIGVDHGTSDPGVFLVIGVLGHGRDATLHVLEEVYQTDKDTTWWMDQAERLAREYARFPIRQRWYADASRPDRILDLRRRIREKVPALEARCSVEAGDNAIEAGVDAVADRLVLRLMTAEGETLLEADQTAEGELVNVKRYARLYVDPSCVNTISEFGLYKRKRDPRNTEHVLDDILDRDNHAMDALRYAVFTRFGGPDKRRHELPTHNAPTPRLYR